MIRGDSELFQVDTFGLRCQTVERVEHEMQFLSCQQLEQLCRFYQCNIEILTDKIRKRFRIPYDCELEFDEDEDV